MTIDGDELQTVAKRARLRLLKMHFDAKMGHIGGNLSALDAMLSLHHCVMTSDDAFVLSKGHSAGALYIALWSKGLLSDEDLETFHADGTQLAGHPVPGWHDSIPIATGSLGHGFPVAVGMALARQLRTTPGRVFCLTSDGEWQEGAMWEALIFWSHHKLQNLTLLVDLNGLQGFGTTHDVASMADLGARIRSFGVQVLEVDGHDLLGIARAANNNPGAVLLLRTKKGKGVSYMEDKMEWHYHPMSASQYSLAVVEITGSESGNES